MAANPCDCQQCRIRRELFGGAATTPEQREEAVYSLAFVLGGLLAWFDDAWLSRILQQVVDTRAERLAELTQKQQATAPDLSRMEVAGRG